MQLNNDTGDPSQNLANAIIVQACTEWRKAKKYLDSEQVKDYLAQKQGDESFLESSRIENKINQANRTIYDCESFFLGDWYAQLTNLDGSYLLNRLKKDYEEGKNEG